MRQFQIRIGSYEVNAVIRDPGRRVSAFSRAVIPGCLPGLIKSAGIAYFRSFRLIEYRYSSVSFPCDGLDHAKEEVIHPYPDLCQSSLYGADVSLRYIS